MSDRDDELIRRFLEGRDETCPVCRYSLKDLPGGVCPECGLALELKLSLIKPRQRAYVSGLVGLGAGVGFNGLILGWLAWVSIWGGWWWDWGELVSLVGSLVGLSVFVVIWARSWGFFQRRTWWVRWGLVLGCWILTIGTAVLFFAIVD